MAVAVLAMAFLTHVFAQTYGGGPRVLLFSFAPLGLFGAALLLARSKVGSTCTVVLLALVTAWAVWAAYGVFQQTQRGQVVDAMGFSMHTLVQAYLGLVALVVASVDWLVHRSK